MKHVVPLIALILVACGPGVETSTPDRTEPRLPGSLDRLLLAEDVHDMTPVSFGHDIHIDAEIMGKVMACADCHHELEHAPDRIPQRCSACHASEGQARARAEGDPPDL